MHKRSIAALIVCALCAVSIAYAAPSVDTWGGRQPFTIYSDTLAHTANDSVATTLAVPVFGARYICLVATSTASDSVAVPIMQTHLPNGSWTGSGNALAMPWNCPTVWTTNTPTTIVNSTGVTLLAADNEYTLASGYAMGTPIDSLRFRLKGNTAMLRLYKNNGGIATNGGSTGTITVRAFVWY